MQLETPPLPDQQSTAPMGIFIPAEEHVEASWFRKLNLRNFVALLRYARLRLRHRQIHGVPFYLGARSVIDVGQDADINIARGVVIARDFTGNFKGHISLGERVYFNRGCRVSGLHHISIGADTRAGEYVSIHDANHLPPVPGQAFRQRGFVAKPVRIGKNVWIGAKATILAGVTIGDNAVIGANAVVTHDVPANSMAIGVPARIVRKKG